MSVFWTKTVGEVLGGASEPFLVINPCEKLHSSKTVQPLNRLLTRQSGPIAAEDYQQTLLGLQ